MSAWSCWFFAEWALRLLSFGVIVMGLDTLHAGFAATAALVAFAALDCRINRLQVEVDRLKAVKDRDPA